MSLHEGEDIVRTCPVITRHLGYLAMGHRGTLHHLSNPRKHPRGQLMKAEGVKSCHKMFVDTKGGESRHVGYVVHGEWFTLYKVHVWAGKES